MDTLYGRIRQPLRELVPVKTLYILPSQGCQLLSPYGWLDMDSYYALPINPCPTANRIFYILKPLGKHNTYRHLVCWDYALISVFKCLSESLFSLCFRLSVEVPDLTFGVVILYTPATIFSLENATFTHFWCLPLVSRKQGGVQLQELS
jgi:hypothetical protein